MLKRLACTFALLLASTAAEAHYIWLERDGLVARAYYGEWAEDVREKTGGYLDRIKDPDAFQAGRGTTLPIERRADHLEIALSGPGDVRFVVDRLAPYEDKRAGGKTRPMLHARTGRQETVAQLDLEFVPIAPNAGEFTLMLRNAPLPKVELTVFGPPKWSKILHSDEQGKVTFPTPWAGRYVVEVVHIEERPGGAGADAYERIRHVSTLSFEVAQGRPWPAQ